MPIFALKPLPKLVHGRVVLLGDAVSGPIERSIERYINEYVDIQAHATTPHWGFGACSSIEV
jgi:hypothetical protein